MADDKGKSFSHLDEKGRAQMVDISEKTPSARSARAEVKVILTAKTLASLLDGEMPKGDVLAAARLAGIMAAKKTSELIPLCHPLPLTKVEITFEAEPETNTLIIRSFCRTDAKTGVEMEALTAASLAALTIYDMCKALDKSIVIDGLCLLEKTGGQSGDWVRGS